MEYDYRCSKCNEVVTLHLSISSDKPKELVCPKCEGDMKRVFSAPTIDWKCSGGTNAGKG